MRRIARKTGIFSLRRRVLPLGGRTCPTAKKLAQTKPTILTYVNFSLNAVFRATPKTAAPAFDSNGAVGN
jgi:hypothetical protein